MVLKMLRVLSLDLQAAERKRHWTWIEHLRFQSKPQVRRFLQQVKTYSNKATFPNPCQVVPLPIDQEFKYVSLWVHSYSMHHVHQQSLAVVIPLNYDCNLLGNMHHPYEGA